MTSDVTELIAALRAGQLSLDQVARRLRERSWPDSPSPDLETHLDMAARALDDPGSYEPGTFDDVLAAYDRGDLTLEEYRVLAQAVAQSIDTADSGELPRDDDPRGWD